MCVFCMCICLFVFSDWGSGNIRLISKTDAVILNLTLWGSKIRNPGRNSSKVLQEISLANSSCTLSDSSRYKYSYRFQAESLGVLDSDGYLEIRLNHLDSLALKNVYSSGVCNVPVGSPVCLLDCEAGIVNYNQTTVYPAFSLVLYHFQPVVDEIVLQQPLYECEFHVLLYECEFNVLLYECEFNVLLYECEFNVLLYECEFNVLLYECEFNVLLYECEFNVLLYECEFNVLLYEFQFNVLLYECESN